MGASYAVCLPSQMWEIDMPAKNLMIILLVSIVSWACYDKAQRNRYAGLFAEAIDRVSSRYVEKVDQRNLFEGAIRGMLDELDPYSSYIGPDDFARFKEELDQEFGGIGIIVSPRLETGELVVLSPVLGTPAHRAGVLAGDIILKVDGEEIEDWRDAVNRLRGIPGTKVRVTLLHAGDEEPTEVTITRAIIQVPSVLGDTLNPDGSWQYVLKSDPRIGYIRLSTFGEHTVKELETAIDTLNQQEMIGLILDLRRNAGGLLTAAIATCDMFIDEGVIVSTRGRGKHTINKVEWATSEVAVDTSFPMVVLVNQFSASASEIVAACLQDHGRAVIVGQRTWGKGTVQNLIPLVLGKSVIKLTTATFWRPSDKNIHRSKNATEDDAWGVIPNEGYEVKLTSEDYRKIENARSAADYGSAYDDADVDTDDDEIDETEPLEGTEQPTKEAREDEGSDAVSESSDGNEDKLKEDEVDEEPFEDPQLRRAIEYIQQQAATRQGSSEAA